MDEFTSSDFTSITRTETFEGFSIPGIIRNSSHYFTDVHVYRDGLFNCWGMVDLAMLKQKIQQGWLAVSIPDDNWLSVFNLGNWQIANGEWLHTKESYYDYLQTLLKRLNPNLENLHDYYGKDFKMVRKARVSKHSLPSAKPFQLEQDGGLFSKKVDGEKFFIIYREKNSATYLATLSLFPNDTMEVTNLPNRKTFQFRDLDRLMEDGVLATNFEINERVTILNLGSFDIKSGNGIDPRAKLTQLHNQFREFHGEENVIRKCSRLFEAYLANPTVQAQRDLKAAYEAIPEHERMFVGDMDTKDFEVRYAIFGEVVKKEWEDHYAFPYPYRDIPRPIDE